MVRFVCAALVAAIVVSTSIAAAQPVPPARLSVATDGTQANGISSLIGVSRDGRHVLFFSVASNLVTGDANRIEDLFIRDRDTDADGVFDEPGAVRTLRVSVGPFGDHAAHIFNGSLSDDGRFVLFDTVARLVEADTNGNGDGYLYDRDTDADGVFDEAGAAGLSLVTTGSGDAPAIGGASSVMQVTADGRYVLFRSLANNLQPRATPVTQIYRKDRVTGVTTLVSSTPDGTPADIEVPAISAVMRDDGRIVALGGGFQALWPLTAGLVTYPWVLRDLESNTFTPVPAPPRPPFPQKFNPSAEVAGFSPDGQRVYLGNVTVVGGFIGASQSGTTIEYDVAGSRILQTLPLVTAGRPFVDGRTLPLTTFLIFSGPNYTDFSRYDRVTGRVTTLVPGDSSSPATADRRTLYRALGGTTELLDERYGVPLPMPAPVQAGLLDVTGTTVFFTSADASILPGGADTNGVEDVFAVDLLSRFDRDGDTLDDRGRSPWGSTMPAPQERTGRPAIPTAMA